MTRTASVHLRLHRIPQSPSPPCVCVCVCVCVCSRLLSQPKATLIDEPSFKTRSLHPTTGEGLGLVAGLDRTLAYSCTHMPYTRHSHSYTQSWITHGNHTIATYNYSKMTSLAVGPMERSAKPCGANVSVPPNSCTPSSSTPTTPVS